jgi:predicted nuclease with TOPRIM domain
VLAAQPIEVAAVVCEGAISAASFNALARASGVSAYAVATGSAGAWDARWFRCFADRRCIVAFDNDKTGREKAEAMAERLRAVARRGDVTVRLPTIEGDWNDVLRARTAREVA